MYAPKRKTGKHIPKHDVGDGTFLTTRQIATRLKTNPHTIRARLAKGWRGEELLTPIGERRRTGQPRTQTAVVAYKLALHFGRRRPTTEEIRKVHPMTESSACYWRNAITIVLERINDRKT